MAQMYSAVVQLHRW